MDSAGCQYSTSLQLKNDQSKTRHYQPGKLPTRSSWRCPAVWQMTTSIGSKGYPWSDVARLCFETNVIEWHSQCWCWRLLPFCLAGWPSNHQWLRKPAMQQPCFSKTTFGFQCRLNIRLKSKSYLKSGQTIKIWFKLASHRQPTDLAALSSTIVRYGLSRSMSTPTSGTGHPWPSLKLWTGKMDSWKVCIDQ